MSQDSTAYTPPKLGEDAPFDVHIVPCLSDNYSYIVVDKSSKRVALVDPVEPEKVLKALKDHLEMELSSVRYVLTTHHHWDHAGGNDKLATLISKSGASDTAIVAGADDSARVPSCNLEVVHDQVLTMGGLKIRAIHTPCHTRGHICYFVQPEDDAKKDGEDTIQTTSHACAVFSGDTLFAGGCGRLFEGTAADMYQNLTQKLGTLPPDTLVYAGHEYTRSNLAFALDVAEPNNSDIKAKLAWVDARSKGTPSLPSSIRDELATNVFMRAKDLDRFTELRHAKDTWKG